MLKSCNKFLLSDLNASVSSEVPPRISIIGWVFARVGQSRVSWLRDVADRNCISRASDTVDLLKCALGDLASDAINKDLSIVESRSFETPALNDQLLSTSYKP